MQGAAGSRPEQRSDSTHSQKRRRERSCSFVSPQRSVKLDPAIAKLPLGHLRFEGRHVGRIIEECKTIGDLVSAFDAPEQRARAWTPRMLRTVEKTLQRLLEATAERGFRGWDEFRKSQPELKPARGASVYFASEKLSRVLPAELDEPVGALHLRNRTVNILEDAGINNLAELVQRSQAGIAMPKAAFVTARDILEALEALVSATTGEGMIDWLDYARARRFAVLPAQVSALHTGELFRRQLSEQITAAVELQFGETGLLILQKRLWSTDGAPLTLEAIGGRIGTTKEYVRATEETIIKMLRRAIWFGDYRNCRFRFRDELLEPLHALAAILERSGKMRFSELEWKQLLSGPAERARRVSKRVDELSSDGDSQAFSLWQWQETLTSAFGLGSKELRSEERLLLELIGFRSIQPKKALSRRLIVPQSKPSKVFRAALRQIERLLAKSPPEGYRLEELDEALRAKFGEQSPNRSELLALLNSLPTLDPSGGMGRYRGRISGLKRRADRLERILRDHGEPMHYHELAKKAGFVPRSKKSAKPYQAISTQLGADPRFAHVGRTGLWGLASWTALETRTVADLAAHILGESDRVLTEAELFRSMLSRRTLTQSFLVSELKRDRRFIRVAPSTWALAEKIPAPWKAWVRPAETRRESTGS